MTTTPAADPITGPPSDPAAPWDAATVTRLVGLCATICGDRRVAEDLAQETLLQAWRIGDRLHDRAGTDRWLAAIARNVCKRWARRRTAEQARIRRLSAARIDEACETAIELERGELADLLDRTLEMLPPATRDVLVARYLRERTPAEIATNLGMTPAAVSMRISRGKVLLRRALAADPAATDIGPSPIGARRHETDVWCSDCGARRLVMIRSGGRVEFRCPGCTPEPHGRTHVFDVTMPALSPLGAETDARRVLDLASRWVGGYFVQPAGRAPGGPRRCLRCGHAVVLTPYLRAPDRHGTASATRLGLVARCDRCQTEVTSSLAGMALAHPAASHLRGSRRIHPLPLRRVEAGGRSSYVVGYRPTQGSGGLDAVFDRQGLRLISTHVLPG